MYIRLEKLSRFTVRGIIYPSDLLLATAKRNVDIYYNEKKNEWVAEKNNVILEYPQLRVPRLSDFRVVLGDRHSTLSFLTKSPLFLIASESARAEHCLVCVSFLFRFSSTIR